MLIVVAAAVVVVFRLLWFLLLVLCCAGCFFTSGTEKEKDRGSRTQKKLTLSCLPETKRFNHSEPRKRRNIYIYYALLIQISPTNKSDVYSF